MRTAPPTRHGPRRPRWLPALLVPLILAAGGCARPGVSAATAGTADGPRRVCVLTGVTGYPGGGVLHVGQLPEYSDDLKVAGQTQYWNSRNCEPGQLNPATDRLSCGDLPGWLTHKALNLGKGSIAAAVDLSVDGWAVTETVQYHDQPGAAAEALSTAMAHCPAPRGDWRDGFAVYWLAGGPDVLWVAGSDQLTLTLAVAGVSPADRPALLRAAIQSATELLQPARRNDMTFPPRFGG